MVISINSDFLIAVTPSLKTLESNMVPRSLVLHKILHKHTSNGSKNKKKDIQTQNIKKKIKEKKNHEREIHVKDTLKLEDERFIEIKEQKQ